MVSLPKSPFMYIAVAAVFLTIISVVFFYKEIDNLRNNNASIKSQISKLEKTTGVLAQSNDTMHCTVNDILSKQQSVPKPVVQQVPVHRAVQTPAVQAQAQAPVQTPVQTPVVQVQAQAQAQAPVQTPVVQAQAPKKKRRKEFLLENSDEEN